MSGLIWIQLFDTLKVFLKFFVKKVNCKGNRQTNKILEKNNQHSKSECLEMMMFYSAISNIIFSSKDLRPVCGNWYVRKVAGNYVEQVSDLPVREQISDCLKANKCL